MIYLGYFSFAREASVQGDEAEPSHGYCTCVTDAESVDEAIEQFKTLLHRLRATEDVFDEIEQIYLNACVEIKSIPAGGFLAHYSALRGEHHGEIATWLRGVGEDQAAAYYVGREDQEDEDQTSTDEPFVVFP